MSGGSLDYVYHRVTDAVDTIRRSCSSPLHQAFASHLDKVSKALHDVEWVLSCDYGDGDDVKAILAVISLEDVLAQTVTAALEAKANLDDALAAVVKKSPSTTSTISAGLSIEDAIIVEIDRLYPHYQSATAQDSGRRQMLEYLKQFAMNAKAAALVTDGKQ